MSKSDTYVVRWLALVCATVFTMIVVGGITRLTESGLSMVDWRPILGTLPPMNEAEWQATFDDYRESPQYVKVNKGMSLEAFKEIFFWEYVHRLLGRVIGLVFFIPFVVLWWRGHIARELRPWLIVALVLGGSQGLLGWYMVKSGLVDMPRVSHYRLAAHLLLAMFIFCYLYWLILRISATPRVKVPGGQRWLVFGTAAALFLQLLYGAFTAGMRAGYGYNTFPLMNGQFMADAVFFMEPLWINLVESSATIQFIHRWLAFVVLALALASCFALRRSGPGLSLAAGMLVAALLGQIGLGILTLVYVVPITLGSLHQAWACLVLLAMVYLLYRVTGREPATA